MARLRKTILRVGTYHSPDGKVEVTPERLKHWAEGFKKLTAAKYRVPGDWNHSDDPAQLVPVKLTSGAASPKNTVGHLSAFEVSADGKSAEIDFDVPTEEAAQKLKENLAFVSPVILDKWVDGANNKYKDVITRVDLVHHPVDHSQGPFEEVPASTACALRMGLSSGQGVALSKAYRLAAEDDQDSEKSGDKDDASQFGNDDPEETADELKSGEAKKSARGSLLQKLVTKFGIELADGMKPDSEEALDAVLTGLLNKELPKSDSDPEEEIPGAEDLEVAKEEAVMMSLDKNPELKAHVEYANKSHRESIAKRLSLLCDSGRCTPDEMKSKQPAISVIKLSLDASGQPAISDVEQWIASREAIPEGTFWDTATRTKRMGEMKVVAQKLGLDGGGNDISDAEAEAIVDGIYGKKK